MGVIQDTAKKKSLTDVYTLHSVWSCFLKRCFDLVTSLLGLIILFPFLLFVAILIKRSSPGPVFYRGPRMGKDGKEFAILKFRTMREEEASYNGLRITASGDVRITPLGMWLRATKINELPQLWNVLKGEMSLVGPRPEDPIFVEKWPEKARRIILSVRPGITSPASISYRDEEKKLHQTSVIDDYILKIAPDKLRMDVLYVRRLSFFSDLDVIFLTAVMLLPRLRDLDVPEWTFYSGPMYQFVRRFLSWFVVDTLIAFVSLVVAGLFWRVGSPLHLGWKVSLGLAAGLSILYSGFNSILGLNRVSWRYASASLVFKLIFSSSLVILSVGITHNFNLLFSKLPLDIIWMASILSLFGMIIVRYRERLLTGFASRWLRMRRKATSVLGERALIVGGGEQAQLISWLLKRGAFSRMVFIVGMVDDDVYKVGMRIGEFRVLGSIPEIPALVEKKEIGLILFAINNISPLERNRILNLCRQTSARVVVVPDLIKILRDELIGKEENP